MTKRIADKNGRYGTTVKFVRRMYIRSICQTTKYTEMRKGWRFGVEKLKRSFKREDWGRQPIDEVNSSKSTFPPKLGRKLSLKFQSPSYLQNVTMFAFHNPILLRRVNTRVLKNDTIILKKRTKRNKFSTIITLKSLNVGFKLSENKTEKSF